MENASKALLIAGAILLAILIIAIGMFIYNSAQATVNDSLTSMSTQEVEAFNNQFNSYEQEQTGSNVKALIGRLIANANTYEEESAKVPKIIYLPGTSANYTDNSHGTKANAYATTDSKTEDYIKGLSTLRNNIENKHKYWVTMEAGTSGVITYIQIEYGETKNNTTTYTKTMSN